MIRNRIGITVIFQRYKLFFQQGMDSFFPDPTANFRCGSPKMLPDDFKGAFDFDFDFEYEGNFTLTWSLAVCN